MFALQLQITTDFEIANCFNSYFTSIGPSLARKFEVTTSMESRQNSYKSLDASFMFTEIDSLTTETLLKAVNSRKATGLDGIPAKLVKKAAPVIATPLTYIINKTLLSCVFPDSLKIAKVKPLFKKGSIEDCGNYRPISILPIFSKIIEKVINFQIVNYLEKTGILNSKQYGFRKNKN